MNGAEVHVSWPEVDQSCERDNEQINYNATGTFAVSLTFGVFRTQKC
jgi:hypothetical protein